ncbi:type A2 lantipeptide [Streptomyces sp. NPDC050636]|uniref:type A2 lantipeptide n=1 Tax=Streptomyces sp. NPDC050636 TaxID=3154510 RepID=UPI00342BFD3F
MNSTPQVQTQEIADSELDNVAGGLVGGLVGTANGLVASTTGLDVQSTVTGAVGTVEGATGLSTAPVTNLAAGL